MKLKLPPFKKSLVLTAALLAAVSGPRAWAEAPADGVLLNFEADPGHITSQHATANVVDSNGGHALKIDFEAGKGYPAVQLAAPSGNWDLSKYKGVEAEITNTGETTVNVALRVDNPGDWQQSPWNTESVTLQPGDTKVIQVTFGFSYGGQKGYDLDPTNIARVVVFAANPGDGASVTVDNIKGFDPK